MENNLSRAFFLIQDPSLEKYWGPNDMIEFAFQEVVRLNLIVVSKKVTCIGFDWENLYLDKKNNTDYSTKDGSLWITNIFQKYLPNIPVDWDGLREE